LRKKDREKRARTPATFTCSFRELGANSGFLQRERRIEGQHCCSLERCREEKRVV
jgi:hypothetical protein